jgi:hypothetical protein
METYEGSEYSFVVDRIWWSDKEMEGEVGLEKEERTVRGGCGLCDTADHTWPDTRNSEAHVS